MSGDVEVYEAPAASALEQWGRDAHLISAVAVNLVKTAFVPASYNGDPAQATAAILTGQEIGLKPMAALRSIDVIKGVPAMRAIAMRALVQSHGHEIWTVESTRTRAVVRGQRKGSDKVETSEWTTERAREMALLNKDNWKLQPTSMLLARATSECARLIAADVLLGVPYSVEEVQDLDLEVKEDAPRKGPVRRTVKRAALPSSPAPEPPLPGEAESGGQLALDPVSEPAAAVEPVPVLEPVAEPDPAAPAPEEFDAVASDVAEAEAAAAEPVTSWPVARVPGSMEPPLDWEPPMEDEPR